VLHFKKIKRRPAMIKVFSVYIAIISLLLVFMMVGTACDNKTSQPEDSIPTEPARVEQNEPAPAKPATFKVGDLNIQPANIMVGDTVVVSTIVSNTGDEQGEYTAIFTVAGEEIDREVLSINGRESAEASFNHIIPDAGEYEFTIGDSHVAATVHEWTPCEIRYDKGVIKHESYYYLTGEDSHIVFFSPETDTFKINKIRICGVTVVANLNELKERQFTVTVWDKNMDTLLWSEDFPWQLFKGSLGWIDVDVPDIRIDDEFIVEFASHSEPSRLEGNRPIYTAIGVAWERNESDEIRSGMTVNGTMYTSPEHNWFIRVEGECAKID
jgi:hypothetical protein